MLKLTKEERDLIQAVKLRVISLHGGLEAALVCYQHYDLGAWAAAPVRLLAIFERLDKETKATHKGGGRKHAAPGTLRAKLLESMKSPELADRDLTSKQICALASQLGYKPNVRHLITRMHRDGDLEMKYNPQMGVNTYRVKP